MSHSLIWACHRALPLRCHRHHSQCHTLHLTGSGKPTVWPQGFLDITGWVTSLLKTFQLFRGAVSAPAAPTGSSLTEYPQIPSTQTCPAHHSTAARTFHTGTDGLSRQSPSPGACRVQAAQVLLCVSGFSPGCLSWEDCFVAVRDRLNLLKEETGSEVKIARRNFRRALRTK